MTFRIGRVGTYLAPDAGGGCMHVTCTTWVSLPSSVEQVRHGRTGCAPGRQAGRPQWRSRSAAADTHLSGRPLAFLLAAQR